MHGIVGVSFSFIVSSYGDYIFILEEVYMKL
jgi:hypothetical protein